MTELATASLAKPEQPGTELSEAEIEALVDQNLKEYRDGNLLVGSPE